MDEQGPIEIQMVIKNPEQRFFLISDRYCFIILRNFYRISPT